MQPRHSSPSNQAQRESNTYRLAEMDRDFLLGNSTRGIRLQLEYQKVEERLRAWGVRSTVVVFGSARIRPDGPPQHRQWYDQARSFARIVSQRGGAICATNNPRDNVIATGGGPGLMEAANRGAMDAGAPSIGFNIALMHEQEPNPYSTPELTFLFQYFAIRKLHLAMRANALVIFPGGFGTLDEMFEILTLKQSKKAAAIPILLFDESFWRRIVNLDQLALEGMIREEDLALFSFADTPESAWERLERHIAGAGAPCHADSI